MTIYYNVSARTSLETTEILSRLAIITEMQRVERALLITTSLIVEATTTTLRNIQDEPVRDICSTDGTVLDGVAAVGATANVLTRKECDRSPQLHTHNALVLKDISSC